MQYNGSQDNISDVICSPLNIRPLTKSAVSYLQELIAKRGQIHPCYTSNIFDYLKSGFRFGCTVTVIYQKRKFFNKKKITFFLSVLISSFIEFLTCQGLGNCKKDAKNDAAEKMYKLLTKRNLPCPTKVHSSGSIQPPAPVSYINLLQEAAVRDGHAMPIYQNERSMGLPHLPVFQVDCVWRQEQTTGEANTKKLAKNNAAKNMYTKFA